MLSYVGILMLVLESVLQILRHQFMLPSILQEFKNTPQKDLNGVWKHNPVVSICVVVCILSPTFWKDDRNGVGEAAGIEQKLSLILEADFWIVIAVAGIFRTVVYTFDDDQQCVSTSTRHMGGNVLLAQAGGLYHEIGRITGDSNYIDAGVKLAEEYDFPRELTDIIRQHSMRHEKPKSLEAAIVLFTDCIVSTNEYLEKTVRRKVFLHRSW